MVLPLFVTLAAFGAVSVKITLIRRIDDIYLLTLVPESVHITEVLPFAPCYTEKNPQKIGNFTTKKNQEMRLVEWK